MEDMIKALLDVVRAQHSAAEGTEEAPFNMEDIVDMAMNIVGRPYEEEEEAEMIENIQKMVENLAPDIFPPKTFEEMDGSEQALSAGSMIEERLRRGRTMSAQERHPENSPATGADTPPSSVLEENTAPSLPEDAYEEEEETSSFNPQEAADLNDMIYKNLMEMMGLQSPQVEFPFDQSQLQYGREKSVTEMLEEEKQNEEAKRQEQTMYEKEDDLPQAEEEPQTKSASQLAAEAIRRSQEEEREKLEIEKKAERLMEEARKRGQDPMKFALHQQEILQYMEKNSDELVSFEDYEDLSPEEKLEIERRMHIEKQIADGVDPEKVNTDVPEEFIPEELREREIAGRQADKEAAALADNEPEEESHSVKAMAETAAGVNPSGAPVLTEEMLRQLSQEVIRENSDMILSDNAHEDMDSLNETIFENIRQMMSGSGKAVAEENVDDLLEEAAEADKQRGLSAVELARAAQQAAKPEPQEKKESKSAVELAKEAQAKEEKAKEERKAETDAAAETLSAEEELDHLFDDIEEAEFGEETEEKDAEQEAAVEEEEKTLPKTETSTEGVSKEVRKEEETTGSLPQTEEVQKEETAEHVSQEEEMIQEEAEEKAVVQETAPADPSVESEAEEYVYVDPAELVLGEHTQAEIDEALENLNSLGLEGDVYQRAKRMLLLELAGSEAELDAWLAEQKQGKKKKAAVSALDDEEGNLEDLDDLDEDSLERELELAMDEDFLDAAEEDGCDPSRSAQDNEEENEVPEEETEEADDKEEAEEKEANAEEETEEEEDAGAETEEEINDGEETDEIISEIEVENPVPQPSRKKTEHRKTVKAVSRKKVVKKKEKNLSEKKMTGAKMGENPDAQAEAKSYQVSVRHPFILKNSASFMDQFEEYITDTQENRKLSTGFKKLDAMLRYGLHKGSYFVDAEPQYLKNGFMQQMADRAAESGVDVLYISTELSRYDLMVETISRISYEIHGGDRHKAVSAMDIMTGEDGADLRSLKDELNWYRGRISEHLYILDQEAVSDYTDSMEEVSGGEILAELIRSIVREGAHKPVVFIDNIENILSAEDAEDMKPLMEGIRKLAGELSIPILLSYGYAQAETETELDPAEKEFHASLGNMCDVYMELNYVDMITEDSVELTEEDIQEMVEDGDTLLMEVLIHRNRRAMKASCQIQGVPKYNYFEE